MSGIWARFGPGCRAPRRLALLAAALVASCGGDDDPAADAGGSDAAAGPDAASFDAPSPDAGNVAPGCASPDDPTLTASERLLLELPAGSWYTAPDTKLLDLCSTVTSHGDGVYLVIGCRGITDAWGGGAFDSLRQRMVVWGGGHNDYGGNEVYVFDLPTMTWLQLTSPSQPPFNQDPLADGNPVSRHTYDGVEFLVHRDSILGWGGSRATDGSGTDLTWEFDLVSMTWTNRDPTPPEYSSSYDFGLAYDPISQDVFMHAHAKLSVYDPDANSWTLLEDFGYPPWSGTFDSWSSRTGVVDPGRRHFVTAGDGAALLVYDVDADEVLSLSGPWSTVTGGETVLGRAAPGLAYDVAAEQIVAWSGGAPIALDADAKAWSALPGADPPASQNGTGTYGRWQYVERYNVFILVNSATEEVLFYKRTPGCGA